MAAVTTISFTAAVQSPDLNSSARSYSNFDAFKLRSAVAYDACSFRASSSSRMVVHCMCTSVAFGTYESLEDWNSCFSGLDLMYLDGNDVPTVSQTKLNFLKAYKRPIPSIYNTVLQELIVQQHLTKYKKSFRYDPVFALGFVTVYNRLMEGYPSDEDRQAIFEAYVRALNDDPAQFSADAQKVEEWAKTQSPSSLVEFASRDGEIEGILKDIAERAGTKGSFSYSRFFAVGLFRLLELSNATEPTILDKLCAALNANKKSVDRDLDVYRNLLSKLVQAKELLKEYTEREKKKTEERAAASQKANEAVAK
ncbi:Protein THYLAKOID FORMATION 1, chloroplastic, variant 2 [Salvia divinorum]|uniref:Protein THYLAKOID FORMATION 1, chloroplastic, variant 2 n=1 Tax=Salvia divinorum TaxID=28513 RepID=A0ABD1I116_SALDI